MGYEFITQPQVFTAGITALGGIQGEVLKYPEIISYRSWTDTIVANTTSISIPGSFPISDSSEAYIVNIGGVVQFPNTYTITGDRKINFNSVLSAGIEYGITLLATAAPSATSFTYVNSVCANFINLSAVNTYSNNLTAENLFVTNLTALSSQLNVVNLTQYELSGFSVFGDANVHGNVIVSNLLSSLNTRTTNTSATNLTALNVFIRRGGSIISETSASTVDVGLINTREFNIVHTPANDGVDPIFNIGETNAGSFTGIRTTFEEGANRAVITSRTGSAVLTSVAIDVTTGQVAISGLPAAGQALTVSGSLSANNLISPNISASRINITNNIVLTGNIISTPSISAMGTFTGPTAVAGSNDVYYTFTGNGNFIINNFSQKVEVLVVGGGGGGGGRYYAGGGGGGGVRDLTLTLPAGTYDIQVGTGGLGGNGDYVVGADGNASRFYNTSLGTIISLGGGGGGSYTGAPYHFGKIGACGGGNSGYSGTLNYDISQALTLFFNSEGGVGYEGGVGATYGGGGGGGMGSVGVNGTGSNGGNGGAGVSSNITGTSLFYGAGGGGGAYNGTGGTGGSSIGGNGASASGTTSPTSGTANRGAGGGGACNLLVGGNGSDGIVIVRVIR